MKIIISSNSYWNLYNFRKELIERLISNNFEVILVAPEDIYKEYFIKLNCKLIDIEFKKNKISLIKDFFLIFKYFIILLNEKPDYLLTYTVKPNIFFSLSAFFFRIKILNNITGLGTIFISKNIFLKFFLTFLYKISFFKSFKIFFHNESDLNYFIKLKIVNKNNSIFLPGSGVNLEKFKFVKLKNHEINLNLNFLFFGRMLKEKGVDDLIKASIIVKKIFKNTTFTFVGSCDTQNKSSLSIDYLKDLDRRGVISYFEHTDDIIKLINVCDCVILPSYREGFPKSLIEASAIGRPMLTSNVPGCNDIVIDGYNGFLFNVSDIDNLCETIIKYINLNYNLKNQMSLNAYKKAINEFDEKIIVNKYIETINI